MLNPMLLRRAPGIVAALLLVPLTILAAAPLSSTVMVCRMTGAVTWAPCAPAEDTSPSAHDALADAGCCDYLTVSHASAPSDTVTVPELPRPTLAAGMTFKPRPSSLTPAHGPNLKTTAPPGAGPPIRQRTQTFLI